MVDIISNLKKVEKSRIAMIGDRLYTDIENGQRIAVWLLL